MDLKNSAVFAAYNNAENIVKQPTATQESGVNFGAMVTDSLDNTAAVLQKAEQMTAGALVDEVSLEELAGAVANAEITLKTVVAVRDRIINAYQDIIKMPI